MSKRNINRQWLACPPLETWAATQAGAPTENRTCGPLVCRPAPNPLRRTSQDLTSHLGDRCPPGTLPLPSDGPPPNMTVFFPGLWASGAFRAPR